MNPTLLVHSLVLFGLNGILSGAAPASAAAENTLAVSSRFFLSDFLPAGASCTRGGPYHYPKCGKGLWCIGKISPRCRLRVKVGGECGADDQLCELRSRCQAGRCRAIPRMPQNYLPKLAACAPGGPRCFPGFWCIVGRCRRLVPCGGVCGTQTKVCRPGLRCRTERISGKRVCARIHGMTEEVRTRGQQCFDGKTRCRTGLVCVVRLRGRCNKTGEEGRRCVRETPGTCKIPARLEASCGAEFSDCEPGRKCYISRETGIDDVGRCVQ